LGLAEIVARVPPGVPVLIAGPTASGKSALALAIAETRGGVVVNADALQVFDAWPILTAQPSASDRARAPHLLYGHLPFDAAWSAGDWLRAVRPLLDHGPGRPVIVGGTGLFFAALTEGLAEIPPVPAEVRAEADALLRTKGPAAMAAALDPATRDRIDPANPARVQRAWEVLRATGRGLAEWQAATPPPDLPLGRAHALLIDAPKDWLAPRIERRFDAMLAAGALEEARRESTRWNPALQSSRAIGAAELVAHVRGEITLPEARAAAIIATRQYAKRQRTWFRSRMQGWRHVDPQDLG
jgi:tRNA dimethylallyltransferase